MRILDLGIARKSERDKALLGPYQINLIETKEVTSRESNTQDTEITEIQENERHVSENQGARTQMTK